MFSPRSRAALVIVLSLIAGAILGIAADRTVLQRVGRRPPDPRRAGEHFARMLEHRLDLTDEQKAKVQAIISRHSDATEAIFRETQPRIHAQMEATDREIEALLTPEQREKFHELVRERNAHHPPPPPPPGPR
jgi:Spy/CpxP family protein refolding chaperone